VKILNNSKVVTWSLGALIENLNKLDRVKEDSKIPMFISNINVFPQSTSHSLINFQPLIVKVSNNKHQFQFFFLYEKNHRFSDIHI